MATNVQKVDEAILLKMNSLGYSLSTIAKTFNCHPSTVTNRLIDLGIPASDTRRTFGEDILKRLSEDQIEWLYSQLSNHHNIKDFLTSLLIKEYTTQRKNNAAPIR